MMNIFGLELAGLGNRDYPPDIRDYDRTLRDAVTFVDILFC